MTPPPATTDPSRSPADTATTPPPTPLSLLVLGDSIAISANGCNTCDSFDTQYAAALEARTGRPVTLLNLARPNATIATLTGQLDEAATEAAIAAADIVIVSIGYNDGPPWPEAAPCHAPEVNEIIDYWRVLVGFSEACIRETMAWYRPSLDALYARVEALAAGRPQVRTSFGMFNNWIAHPDNPPDLPVDLYQTGVPATVSIHDQWNAQDCELAKAHGFTCLDVYHAFNGPRGDRPLGAMVVDDYVHLSAAGHDVIAGLLRRIDLAALH